MISAWKLLEKIRYSAFLLLVMAAVGELGPFLDLPSNWNAMGKVMFSGALGFSILYLTSTLVQITSPVTYQIISSLRLILQVMIGVFAFKEPMTQSKIIGTCLVFSGSLLYGAFKSGGFDTGTSKTNIKTVTKPKNNFV